MSENYLSRSALQGVGPADVLAMREVQETAPDVMTALVAGCNGMARHDDVDVASLAVLKVARLWQDRREGMALPAVVAAAVRMARREVGQVRQADAEWRDLYGDASDAADLSDDGIGLPMLAPTYGPRPEDGLSIGAADVLATWAGMGADETARTWLADAAAAWVAYDRDGGHDRPGRPLALSGAIANRNGWKSSQAGYRASRTATDAALSTVAGVTREDVLRAMPDGERPGWSAPSGVSRVHLRDDRRGRTPEAWEDVVVVRIVRDALGYPAALGYGEPCNGEEVIVRRLTDGERLRVERPATGAPERTAAPEVATFHETARPGDDGVHLPSRKVAPSPRKRGPLGGVGGPVIPARF